MGVLPPGDTFFWNSPNDSHLKFLIGTHAIGQVLSDKKQRLRLTQSKQLSALRAHVEFPSNKKNTTFVEHYLPKFG